MPIFTKAGKELGKAFDLVINLPEGRVERITLESVAAASREEAKRIFREKTIAFTSVTAISEIIIVSSELAASAPIEEETPEQKPTTSYRHRFGRH